MAITVSVFCTPGGHSVKFLVSAEITDPLTTPPGWTCVEADHLPDPIVPGPNEPWRPGIWYAKEGTGCRVLCCPDHPLVQL